MARRDHALGVIGVLALGGKNVAGHKGAGPASDIADVVLGVLLLFLAARRWMRGRGGAEEKEPRLLKSIRLPAAAHRVRLRGPRSSW